MKAAHTHLSAEVHSSLRTVGGYFSASCGFEDHDLVCAFLSQSCRNCAPWPKDTFTHSYSTLPRTMPRSFLVKKYFAKQKPNYSELECQNDTSLERYPLAELTSGDNTSTATCFTTGLVWDLSVLPALYLPTSQTEPSVAPGPLDLSSPSSLSSSASSCGEEDEGRTSDPPSPEPVHTYAPRQRMKCTGVMAHISPPEEEEEREAPITAARPAFLCKHCPKEYTSLGALKMHIRSHTLPCVCTTCGKAFSRPWLLRGHIRTHTGERPFSCPHCNRAFADRSNLRAHLQTHAEVKKYQCGICSRTFSRMSLLQKHSSSGCCSTAV